MSRGFSQSATGRERRAVVRRAFLDSLPVLMGYTSMGFVAGVLLAAKASLDHPVLWGALTSASCISGTFNFAIVQPVAERAPLWSVALLVVGINFRYVFYGFAMLGRWQGVSPLKKAFLVHTLADENFALEASCRYRGREAFTRYCLSLSAMNLSYWVAGVVSGALSVVALRGAVDPDRLRQWTNGMEFAMVALFIVILTEQTREMFRHGK